MLAKLNSVLTPSAQRRNRKRSDRYRRQMLQLEPLQRRVVFDGDGLHAINDLYEVEVGNTLQVATSGVLANDIKLTDSESDISAELYRGPSHGTLQLNEDGSFAYTPDEGFQGTDSFLYRTNQSQESSNIAAVTIHVVAANTTPESVDDSYSMNEDGILDVGGANGVLNNDLDLDGDSLNAQLITGPSHGSITLQANGGFEYKPSPQFVGLDTFVYAASDGAGSDQATVTIQVNGVNDIPLGVNDRYSIGEDGELAVDSGGILSNDLDIDDSSLTAILGMEPEHGTLQLDADGTFLYKPNANFHGIDTFTYLASDGKSESGMVVVEILVESVNDAPEAFNDQYSLIEDGELDVGSQGVLSNDRDIDNDALKAILDVGPEHGTLSLDEDGSFTYRPTANFHGTDAFSYRAFDGTAYSEIVVVEIRVDPVNDAPTGENDTFSLDEDGILSQGAHNVLANDRDADQDTLTAVLDAGPEHGELQLNADGTFTYTPDPNFHGTDAFSYRASDGQEMSEVIAVQIDVKSINDAPVGRDDSYETAKGAKLVVAAPGLLSNDTDADLDLLSIIPGTAPEHGQLLLNADGSFEYTPNPNYRGSDQFTYKTFDGVALSEVNTVRIRVTGENTRPVAVNDSFSTISGTPLQISSAQSILINDQDAEGDVLNTQLYRSTRNGILTLSPNGTFSYTPNEGFVGTDSFLYRANDGELNSFLAAVTIHVRPSPPTVASLSTSRSSLQGDQVDQAMMSLFSESPLGSRLRSPLSRI